MVLIKHTKEGFKSQSELNQSAPKLNYSETPNFSKSISDYDQFVKLLKSFNIEIHYLPYNNNTTPDSIYTHDPCIVSNKGVILCSMGKDDRHSEVPFGEGYFWQLPVTVPQANVTYDASLVTLGQGRSLFFGYAIGRRWSYVSGCRINNSFFHFRDSY